MACYTSFVNVIAGQWVQLCEYRPGRRALIIDVQNCSLILDFSAQATQTQSAAGVSPPGLLISPNSGNGRTIFRLHADDDGDLTEQAWYAWAIGGTILPPVIKTDTFNNSGTWQGPFGVNVADVTCVGCPGCTQASSPGNGASSGGGGGAYAETTNFTIIPGFTYTVNCVPGITGIAGVQAAPTWFSNTGVAPLTTAQGVLADSGRGGANAGANPGGLGGNAGLSLGTITTGGGAGGAVPAGFAPGGGQTGGGGGGYGSASAPGTAGAAGVTGVHPSSVGGVTAGGNGGASDGSTPLAGATPNGGGAGGNAVNVGGVTAPTNISGAGIVTIKYTVFTGNAVTVMESYDVPAFNPGPDYINPYSPPPPVIPPMTPEQRYWFAQLLKKWCQRN